MDINIYVKTNKLHIRNHVHKKSAIYSRPQNKQPFHFFCSAIQLIYNKIKKANAAKRKKSVPAATR